MHYIGRLCLLAAVAASSAFAQEMREDGNQLCTLTATARHERSGYQVAPNGRYLLPPDGRPFFWLGDTAWTLCHVLNRAEAVQYLDVRAKQGITVIQIPALMSRYVDRPNAHGDKALLNNNLLRPSVTPGKTPNDTA